MAIESVSIHPRVSKGRTVHDKVNTCRPYKGGGHLAKIQKRLNARRNDHSATLERLHIGDRLGFRTPGSMNEHK